MSALLCPVPTCTGGAQEVLPFGTEGEGLAVRDGLLFIDKDPGGLAQPFTEPHGNTHLDRASPALPIWARGPALL